MEIHSCVRGRIDLAKQDSVARAAGDDDTAVVVGRGRSTLTDRQRGFLLNWIMV
jgi:hypothetical protein